MREVFRLHRDFKYEDDKIIISYQNGEVCKQLSIYLKDSLGNKHHVYWLISDRYHQNFDHTNEKVRNFVKTKISEQILEQERRIKLEEESTKNKAKGLEDLHKYLCDNF